MTRVAVVDAGAGARGAATENESVGDGSNLTTSPSHQPTPGETYGRDSDAAVEPEVRSGEESESVPPLGYASSNDTSTAEPDLGDDSDDASSQPLADDVGSDKFGSRMSRAVKLLKRVADPEDPLTYGKARHAMRSQKGRNNGKARAKKPTVAKTKKSA